MVHAHRDKSVPHHLGLLLDAISTCLPSEPRLGHEAPGSALSLPWYSVYYKPFKIPIPFFATRLRPWETEHQDSMKISIQPEACRATLGLGPDRGAH